MKKYEVPGLEIIKLNNNDIVVTSGCSGDCPFDGIQDEEGGGTCTKVSG